MLRHKKEDLVKILGAGIAEQVLEQLQPKRRDANEGARTGGDAPAGQSTLLHFG